MKSHSIVFLACLILSLYAVLCYAADNGLAITPPMGWNTWCTMGGCGNDYCDDPEIRSIADFMVNSGLSKLGYNYINLDDCWAGPRDADGNITADPKRFPNGMKDLIDYVHSKGLRFGVYTDAGTQTCVGGRPGSYGHYQQDANTYAEWGVDFVKMDYCYASGLVPYVQYPEMSAALNATGRPILFGLCEGGIDNPWIWARAIANMWRATGDHHDNWENTYGIITAFNVLNIAAQYSVPGAWNDPDFLMTDGGGMTYNEYVTEFSFWSMWSAPLIVATDIRNWTLTKQQILANAEVIAVNQDRSRPGSLLLTDSATKGQVFARTMFDGSVTLMFFNANDNDTISLQFSWSALQWGVLGLQFRVRDLWAHKDLGVLPTGFSTVPLAPHASQMIRAWPVFPQAGSRADLM